MENILATSCRLSFSRRIPDRFFSLIVLFLSSTWSYSYSKAWAVLDIYLGKTGSEYWEGFETVDRKNFDSSERWENGVELQNRENERESGGIPV